MPDSVKEKRNGPFLLKCYDMVDDPTTDSIISWSLSGTSFVIWEVFRLEQELLPKYYKHRNFSSFIRQLNQYGFKKYDPDRWEFTNDRFMKGQKHLLTNISRKKFSQGNFQRNQSESNTSTRRITFVGDCQRNSSKENNTPTGRKFSQGICKQTRSLENDTSAGAFVEVGKFRLLEEVEDLKKDKNVVMQEVAKLKHHQQGTDNEVHHLGQRLEGMEISQQQMISFFAMVVRSPKLLGQLLKQNESNWHISKTTNKRSYLAIEQDTVCNDEVSDGQLVRYQPPTNEMPKHLPMVNSNWDITQQFDRFGEGPDDLDSNIDPSSSGESRPVQLEESGHRKNVSHIVITDLSENDWIDKLLASPKSSRDVESEAVNRLTEELELLISQTNK